MRSKRSTQAGVAVLMGVILCYGIYLLGCDGTKPTEPPDPEPKDYLVWLSSYAHDVAYAYHTVTGEVDTFEIAREAVAVDITVSHDGRLLYVPVGTVIRVYDTESLQIVSELPYFADMPVIVSKDGRYIAIPGDSLFILNTHDYSLSFQAPIETGRGCFSADGNTLYTPDYGSYYGGLYTLTNSDTGWSVEHQEFSEVGGPGQVIPTPDKSKLLFMTVMGSFASAFMVYDIARDSIIYLDYLVPGHGLMALTPDAQYAYYGNPGTILAGPVPPSEFTEFDIEANRVVKRISTIHFIDSLTPLFMPIKDVAISPDGTWLIGLQGPAGDGGALLTYNLLDGKLVDFVDLHDLISGLSVQIAP